MASTGDGDDNNNEIEEQLVLNVAKQLRSFILIVDKKIDDLTNLQDDSEINEQEFHETVVSEIEQLRKDQVILRRTFYKLLSQFFWPDERGNLELKQDSCTENSEQIKNLKIKIKGLKKEEDVLNEKASGLLSNFSADSETASTNAGSSLALEVSEESANLDSWLSRESVFSPSSTYNVWNAIEEDDHENARLLSRKVRMIKYYYLSQQVGIQSSTTSVNSGSQHKFGWLRTADDDHDEDDDHDHDEENGFEVTNTDELREKIRRLMHERRRETARFQREGKRSFMDWWIADKGVGRWTSLDALQTKANELGILLSRHVSGFFFMVVESGPALNKFSEHLICILKWLNEMGKTTAIKRIVSALEAAERDLLKKGKFYPLMSAISEGTNPGEQKPLDRILEMFLREVMCLESILSYPNLCEECVTMEDHGEMKSLKTAFEKCEKEVGKIGLEMAYLTAIHKFVFEEKREDLVMEDFQTVIDWTLSSTWGQLEEGYEPN